MKEMVSKGKSESRRPRRGRVLLSVVAFLLLASLAWSIDQSRREIEAIRWHRHHSDRIVANGVSFPLYYWHIPSQSDDFGFEIKDDPGPLRPGDDSLAFIEVNRPEHDHPRGELTPAQLVERQVQDYRKSHYPESVTYVQMVAGQPLQCMQNVFMRTATVYCYGDGPIVHLFFTGGIEQLSHFNRMLALAKKL